MSLTPPLLILLLLLLLQLHTTGAFTLRMSTPSAEKKRILVIGATGRVGGSTVRALRKLPGWGPNSVISVGGRSEAKFAKAKERWASLSQTVVEAFDDVDFVALDHEDRVGLLAVLTNHRFDLIIHTAGPFQRRQAPEVLKAALALKIPYCDVCDDIELSRLAKAYDGQAHTAGVPCLISTGVWPGISSLMAVDVAEALGGPEKTDSIAFEFFTAGSGGAGTTILSATFLILSEKVLAYVKGRPHYYEAASDFRTVAFGDGVGDRQVFRMNLLEAYSCHRVLGVPNVATFFGTSPNVWNLLLRGMAMLPTSVLQDRRLMQALAVVSEPLVRVVDKLTGSTNAMKVVGTSKDGKTTATALYAHQDLETCVGEGIAAFAAQLLAGKIKPGVHYPEEICASPALREDVFRLATTGCFAWQRPPGVGVGVKQEKDRELVPVAKAEL